MKLSWPFYVTLSFGSFMVFILYLVYRTYGVNTDLVSENYYAMEIAYQDKLNKMQAAVDAGIHITTHRKDSLLYIEFNRPVIQHSTKGTITLYRPSEKKSDKTYPIDVNEGTTQIISLDHVDIGMYQLQVDWSNEHAAFYIERELKIQ
ncbi:MAG: FixH family protein [Cytophagaceae bacterium]|jgi:hypothetical protein|nr:FixH family protein [Cytophagaceae bacterium]